MTTFRTNTEIKTRFKPSSGQIYHDLVIPKGTRCIKADHDQFFVDDLSFIDKNSLTWHDAYYYGIRLDSVQVEEI